MKKAVLCVVFGLAGLYAHAYEFTAPHPFSSLSSLKPLITETDSMPVNLFAEDYKEMPAELACKSYLLHDADFAVEKRSAKVAEEKNIKPYTFKQDMTYVGVPIFVAGIIAKSEKRSFRQDYNNPKANTRLVTNFHNTIDNYTQYAPLILTAGLNFAGVEGRSDHWRFLASGAMSYALMAAIVNPIKYSCKEMRPDGSTRNSWPSGHTATAFVGATILHKEYGLTRSPWYSVAGYAVATATGVMRVLNNRHWVSDVLSGAGVGIISTELAYGLCDLLFKGKHLKRNDLVTTADIIENPSFFDISMGVGVGSSTLNFSGEDLDMYEPNSEGEYVPADVHLNFAASTVVGAEGAYFFNKYIGVGGRLRIKSTPIKGWNQIMTKEQKGLNDMISRLSPSDGDNDDFSKWISESQLTIQSDHFTEFTADLGLYFNLPLSHRFALGSKLLVGRSVMQDIDIDATAKGSIWANKSEFEQHDYSDPTSPRPTPKWGDAYDVNWDYMTVSGNNTYKFGTGISLTYAYKSNFAWKVFVDYDYTRKHYTMTYNPDEMMYYSYGTNAEMAQARKDKQFDPVSTTTKKNMNSFVFGCAFTVSF